MQHESGPSLRCRHAAGEWPLTCSLPCLAHSLSPQTPMQEMKSLLLIGHMGQYRLMEEGEAVHLYQAMRRETWQRCFVLGPPRCGGGLGVSKE